MVAWQYQLLGPDGEGAELKGMLTKRQKGSNAKLIVPSLYTKM